MPESSSVSEGEDSLRTNAKALKFSSDVIKANSRRWSRSNVSSPEFETPEAEGRKAIGMARRTRKTEF